MKNNNAFYIAHKGHTNVMSGVHEIKLGQLIHSTTFIITCSAQSQKDVVHDTALVFTLEEDV